MTPTPMPPTMIRPVALSEEHVVALGAAVGALLMRAEDDFRRRGFDRSESRELAEVTCADAVNAYELIRVAFL
jgi:hypothetical protein